MSAHAGHFGRLKGRVLINLDVSIARYPNWRSTAFAVS
jgi:hypothetical protein